MAIARFPAVALAVALTLGLARPSAAQYENHVVVPTRSFAFMGLPSATGAVNALRADATGRVWVATPSGVSALAPAVGADPGAPETLLRRAPFFPFRQTDGLIADHVSAVTFAQTGGEDHFFLGFADPHAGGLQYGRVISSSGLSLPLDSRLLEGETDREQVMDLASSGTERVWVATGDGLLEWDVSGEAPAASPENTYSEGEAVVAVAVATGRPGTAAYATDSDLYLVSSGGTPATPGLPERVRRIVDLEFDADGNLWALGETNTGVIVWAYRAADLAESPGSAVPALADETLPLDPGTPTGIAVDNVKAAVWVVADQTTLAESAFHQSFSPETLELSGGWQARATEGRALTAVYADPAGNIWIGSDEGVEALILRILSVDNSRYVGFGTPAVVTVIDVENAGAGQVEVRINGTPHDVPEVEGTPGVFTRSFVFSEEGGEDAIQVTSSASDVPITFEYPYDPEDDRRVLTATASWANVKPFEDDLWIGGPCFVRTLLR